MARNPGLNMAYTRGVERELNALGRSPGNIYYVDSGASNTSDTVNSGTSWDKPLATLDTAIGKCTANNGDVIFLAPGHAETKSATGSLWAADVAGIAIIGLGQGADRATFTLSHTGAVTTISAASITVKNILYVAGIDSVAAPLTISASDCVLEDVEMRDTTDIEFVIGVTTTAAGDRLTVRRFFYNGYTGGNACTNGFQLVGTNIALFDDCRFHGLFSTACIEFNTTACTGIDIRDTWFLNTGTSDLSKNVVDTVGTSTWSVRGYDAVADANFSGGDQAAVGVDDVSALSTLVGTANATTTDSLHGKIGTDTEMADSSLYDMLGANTATTTDSINGKLGTDTEMADRSVYDLINGGGPAALATAARLANDVSLMAGLRLVEESAPMCVLKADGAVLAGADDIFTVAGGPVLCTIVGLVTTVIGGASNAKFQITTTTPAATVDLNAAAVAITTDAAGTIYRNVGATSVFTPSTTLGYALVDPVTVQDTTFYLTPGTVHFTCDGAQSGVVAFYCRYVPLTPSSVVTAAA